jgi:hypothetical protein
LQIQLVPALPRDLAQLTVAKTATSETISQPQHTLPGGRSLMGHGPHGFPLGGELPWDPATRSELRAAGPTAAAQGASGGWGERSMEAGVQLVRGYGPPNVHQWSQQHAHRVQAAAATAMSSFRGVGRDHVVADPTLRSLWLLPQPRMSTSGGRGFKVPPPLRGCWCA